jgi:hypothetical protein
MAKQKTNPFTGRKPSKRFLSPHRFFICLDDVSFRLLQKIQFEEGMTNNRSAMIRMLIHREAKKKKLTKE